MWGLSLVAASRDHSSSRCAGLSLSRPLLLWSTGSRRAGSVAVAHGPSCSATCGIFPDQGSNPCPLHWQADSQPLRHQGSPTSYFLSFDFLYPLTTYCSYSWLYFFCVLAFDLEFLSGWSTAFAMYLPFPVRVFISYIFLFLFMALTFWLKEDPLTFLISADELL